MADRNLKILRRLRLGDDLIAIDGVDGQVPIAMKYDCANATPSRQILARRSEIGRIVLTNVLVRPQGSRLAIDFGFELGILDYWMLLSDWRNGSFAILRVALSVFLGYTLMSSNKILPDEGPKRD